MQEVASHSAAYKICEYFVEILIPTMFLYDQAYVEKFGMYTTGNDEVDRQTYQAPIRVQMTVANMAIHYSEGASISFINPEETKQVYGWIVEHLGDWRNELASDPNRRDVPVEDLRKLERFAESLFETARQYMVTEAQSSTLFRSLDRLGSRGIRRRITKLTDTPTTNASEIKHNPMAQLIAAEVNRRGG